MDSFCGEVQVDYHNIIIFQKRAVRIILGSKEMEYYQPIYVILGIQTVMSL